MPTILPTMRFALIVSWGVGAEEFGGLMSRSYSRVYVHLVFPILEPISFLADGKTLGDWHGYMTGICRSQGCLSLRVGGIENHVHILCRMGKETTIDRLAQEIRQGASNWIRRKFRVREVAWGEDYGSFSVTEENLDNVTRFIVNQEERHQTESFEDEYRKMRVKCGGGHHEVNVHFVFSTKKRYPYLTSSVRPVLHSRMEEIFTELGSPALRVGGTWDHLHMLCRLSRNVLMGHLIREVKKKTAFWLYADQGLRDVRWQAGYGAFSVSPQHVDRVIDYIENQEEHHRLEIYEDQNLW